MQIDQKTSFSKGSQKARNLEKTMTRPRKNTQTNMQHVYLFPFTRVSTPVQNCTQTASNDIIATGTRVGSRGGSPYNVLYCIICNYIVLPCIVFVLRAHVREAHFLQRYVVGYAADICSSKTLIGFRKTSFPKTELISLESA